MELPETAWKRKAPRDASTAPSVAALPRTCSALARIENGCPCTLHETCDPLPAVGDCLTKSPAYDRKSEDDDQQSCGTPGLVERNRGLPAPRCQHRPALGEERRSACLSPSAREARLRICFSSGTRGMAEHAPARERVRRGTIERQD